MSLVFEWDPRKARANLPKHNVTFLEATSVFSNPLARIFVDEYHSSDEPREIIIGHSKARRLLWCASPNRGRTAFASSALAAVRAKNCMTMKKTSKTKTKSKRGNGLRSEYCFDYSKAQPNRFAERTRPGSVAVLLDPDVAQVFRTPESVNDVLRALVVTMPGGARPVTRRAAAQRLK